MDDAPPPLEAAVPSNNNQSDESNDFHQLPPQQIQFRPGMNLQQQQYIQQMGQQFYAAQQLQQMNNGAPLRNIAPRMSCSNDVMRQHATQQAQAQIRGPFIMPQQVLLRQGQQMPMIINGKGPTNLIPVGNQMMQLQQRPDGTTFMTSVQSAPQLMPVPGGVYTINGQQIMVHGNPIMSLPQGVTLVSQQHQQQQNQPVQQHQHQQQNVQKMSSVQPTQGGDDQRPDISMTSTDEAPPSLDRVIDEEEERVKDSQEKTDIVLESLFLKEAERFRRQTENQHIIYHNVDGIVIEESSEPLPLDQFAAVASLTEPDSVEDMVPPVAAAKRGKRTREIVDEQKKSPRKAGVEPETSEKETDQDDQSQLETRPRRKNNELSQLLNMDFGPKSGSRIVDEPKRRSLQQEKEEKEERQRTRPKRRSRGSVEGQKEEVNEDDEPLSKMASSSASSVTQDKDVDDFDPSADEKCVQCGTSLNKKGRSRRRPQYCSKECRVNYLRRASVDRSDSQSLNASSCSTPSGGQCEDVETKSPKKGESKKAASPLKTIKLPTQPPPLPSSSTAIPASKSVSIPIRAKEESPVPSPTADPILVKPEIGDSPVDEQLAIPRGHPDTWAVSDVHSLVVSVCGQEAADKLRAEEIDGPVLLWLSSELRSAPLSLKFGPARKIDHCLDRVRAEWGIPKKQELDFAAPGTLNTEDDVHAWVTSVCKSSDLADMLRNEQVDGYILKTEKWQDLKDLFPMDLKLGPQKKLERLEQSFERLHALWNATK